MTTVLSQIPNLDSLTPVITAAQDGFGGVINALPEEATSVLGNLPGHLDSIGELLPDDPQADWLGGLATGLEGIQTRLPPETAEFIQPLVDGLGSLDGIVAGTPLAQFMEEGSVAGALSDRLPELIDPILEQLGQLPEQFASSDQLEQINIFLQAVADFQADIPTDPEAIADFLAQSFIGLPASLLGPTATIVNGVLAGLDAISEGLATGLPTDALDSVSQSLAAATGLISGMDLTETADYDAVLALLTSARIQQQSAADALATIFGDVKTTLTGFDLSSLRADLEAALAAVPEIDIITVNDVRHTILDVVQGLIDQMQTLDPQLVVGRLQAATAAVEQALNESGLAEARQSIFGVFDEMVAALDGVDVTAVRQAIEDIFDAVQQAVAELNLEEIRAAIETAFTQIEQLIDAIDLQASVDLVVDLVNQVTVALDSIPVVELRQQLEEALAAVETALNSLAQLAQTASAALQSILDALDDIDFGAAAAPAVAAINSIVEMLEAIVPDSLPEPVRALLSEAVEPLQQVNFAAEITQPLLDAFDEIAALPQSAADEIEAGLTAVADKIDALDPAILLRPLQEIYDQAVQALDNFSPETLLQPVQAVLDQVAAALDELNPAQLLEPLQSVFDEMMAAFDQLRPEALLAPLTEAFDQAEALLDNLDLTPFFEELNQLQENLLGQVQQSLVDDLDVSGLPAGAGDLLAGMGPLLGAGAGTIRPGDLFLPLADLYDQLLEAVEAVPADVLLTAFNTLQANTVGALGRVGMLGATVGEKAAVIGAAFTAIDPALILSDLTAAHTDLADALAGLDASLVPPALAGRFQAMQNLAAELEVAAVFAPIQILYADLQAPIQALAQPVDVSGLEALLEPLQAKIERLVPPFLLEEITADNLRQSLEAFSPAGIADEINAIFEDFSALAANLSGAIEPAVEAMLQMLSSQFSGMGLVALQELVTELLATLKEKLAAFDPAIWVTELQETFDAVQAALANLNPAVIGQGLQASFEVARDKLTALDFLPLQQALEEMLALVQAKLKIFSPALLTQRLTAAFDQAKALLDSLDIVAAIRSFSQVLVRLRDELIATLNMAQGTFNEMLAAIPI